MDEQLETTFSSEKEGWEILPSVSELLASVSLSSLEGGKRGAGHKRLCLDAHVPNLIAVSPLSGVDFTKTEAYKQGKIILQDKASCFPAYLLDPHPDFLGEEAGDVIDACAAPGNKTTHLAAILGERDPSLLSLSRDIHHDGSENKNKDEDVESNSSSGGEDDTSNNGKGAADGNGSRKRRTAKRKIFAFEKDNHRAKTLEKMVKTAGSDTFTVIHPGMDFLKVDPFSAEYKNVGALLLDPSCSGSGIVGRDVVPTLHLPIAPGSSSSSSAPRQRESQKRDGTR